MLADECENSFAVDDSFGFVGSCFICLSLVRQVPVYGHIVVEYVFVGVLSDEVVFCVSLLPAYDIWQIFVCFNVQVIGSFYVFSIDVL